jgi:aerobic-type carbon monoxide dehydrogenase small subunit (CoxS/CutS family)
MLFKQDRIAQYYPREQSAGGRTDMPQIRELNINGSAHTVNADPERSLLQALREDLDLTGAKYGCGEGQCGACTVLIDGQPARSCITPVGGVAGKKITTIEGVAKGGNLHPLQEAFVEVDALQCGYCTPGMIMSALALLKKNPGADEAEIARSMQGNVCRCGTYPRIVAAIKQAGKKMREGAK